MNTVTIVRITGYVLIGLGIFAMPFSFGITIPIVIIGIVMASR